MQVNQNKLPAQLIPTSPKGIKSIKKDKWNELYKWQLFAGYGKQSHKIVTSMPLSEYFELGVACIDNEITIAMFLRTAVRNSLRDVKRVARQIKRRGSIRNTIKQGTLFD